MGLKSIVQNAALTAMKGVGDIARPATYQQVTGVTRDLVQGTVVPITVNYSLPRIVFARFKESEIDQSINVTTDQKILFAALDLPITPSSSDLIVDETNRVWELMRRMNDPASALVIFHARTSRSVT